LTISLRVNIVDWPFPEVSMPIDPVSLQALQEIIGGSRDDLNELISGFLDDAPTQLAQMHQAAVAEDVASLKRGAHSLKSNSRDMGALALASACAALETDLGGPARVGDLPGRVHEIATLWTAVRSALQTELTRDGV
jgi:HPt (histidine-containing phosphotransfer) domain-containing protein